MLALIFIAASLQSGQAAYDDYDYSKAISELKTYLSGSPPNAKDRQRAQFLLAMSYYFQRNEPLARAALRDLFRENVDYAIADRRMHHPDALRFYDTERNAYVQSLSVRPTQLVTAPAPKRGTLGDRQPWLRAIPGGVGHFANEDYVGGGSFLAAEVALVALNIAGSVMRYSLQNPNGTYRPGAVEWMVVQNVGAFGAIAVAVVDIVDAFVWSPGRKK